MKRKEDDPWPIPLISWTSLTSNDIDRFSNLLDGDDDFQDTTDELGFGAIRSYYSELFFPGITTLFSRARYFVFVPFLLQKIDRFIRSGRRKGINWYSQLNSWETSINRQFKANHEEQFIGERSIERSFSGIYWPALSKLGLLDAEYDDLSLKDCIHKLALGGRTSRTDDMDELAPHSFLKDEEIIRGSELNKILKFSGIGLMPMSLKKLTLKLTRHEAEYLAKKLTALNPSVEDSKPSNLWGALLKRMQRIPSREDSKHFQGDSANLYQIAIDASIGQEGKQALLFSRLARTMYSAYWYHVLMLAGPKKSRVRSGELRENGLKMMKGLLSSTDSLESYCSTALPRIPQEAKKYGIDIAPIDNETQNLVVAWIRLLHNPEDAFRDKGLRLLRAQEGHVKKTNRARLEGNQVRVDWETMINNQIKSNEFQYPYRFHKAVTIAFDISRGLARKWPAE